MRSYLRPNSAPPSSSPSHHYRQISWNQSLPSIFLNFPHHRFKSRIFQRLWSQISHYVHPITKYKMTCFSSTHTRMWNQFLIVQLKWLFSQTCLWETRLEWTTNIGSWPSLSNFVEFHQLNLTTWSCCASIALSAATTILQYFKYSFCFSTIFFRIVSILFCSLHSWVH
jgi:hypothetical protein